MRLLAQPKAPPSSATTTSGKPKIPVGKQINNGNHWQANHIIIMAKGDFGRLFCVANPDLSHCQRQTYQKIYCRTNMLWQQKQSGIPKGSPSLPSIWIYMPEMNLIYANIMTPKTAELLSRPYILCRSQYRSPAFDSCCRCRRHTARN